MKKGFRHFIPMNALTVIKKTFATFSKQHFKQSAITLQNSQFEYKQFYFKHQNIEYKAHVPKNSNQTLQDFLENFARERSTSNTQFNFRDFEVSRGHKYLNLSHNLNEIETSPNDKDPLTFLDSTLNISNINFRGLKHLSNPYTDSSQALQTYLNSFLDKVHPQMEKVNKDSIISSLKSFNTLDGNKSKTELVIVAILSQLQHAIPEKNIKLDYKLNHKLDLTEINKNNLDDVFLIRNIYNDVHIPVTVLSPSREDNYRNKKFDEEIINNMDVLRKLAIKNKTILNFGIITDFQNWKFNLYHKPKDDFVEKPSDYLTSLKYSLSASTSDVSLNSLSIILRVLAGILTVDQKQVTKRMNP